MYMVGQYMESGYHFIRNPRKTQRQHPTEYWSYLAYGNNPESFLRWVNKTVKKKKHRNSTKKRCDSTRKSSILVTNTK